MHPSASAGLHPSVPMLWVCQGEDEANEEPVSDVAALSTAPSCFFLLRSWSITHHVAETARLRPTSSGCIYSREKSCDVSDRLVLSIRLQQPRLRLDVVCIQTEGVWSIMTRPPHRLTHTPTSIIICRWGDGRRRRGEEGGRSHRGQHVVHDERKVEDLCQGLHLSFTATG